jgi:hypothetical protein
MEAVIGAFIDEAFVVGVVGFQRCFERGPSGIDAGIQAGVVQQQRGLDLGGVGGVELAAVEGRGCGQIGTEAHG